MNINKKIFIGSCIFVTTIVLSYAQSGKGNEGKDRKPPKEAIETCVGQEVGFECTMNTPRGSLTGTCMNTPDEKYFVCMPKDGPNKP